MRGCWSAVLITRQITSACPPAPSSMRRRTTPLVQFAFGGAAAAVPGGGAVARKALYQKTLSQLRALMIARMAKPEEVGSRAACTDCLGRACQGVRVAALKRHRQFRCCAQGCAPHALPLPLSEGRGPDCTTPVASCRACRPKYPSPAAAPSTSPGRPLPLSPLPPSQVIVVEDENGNVVRETMKDTGEAAPGAGQGRAAPTPALHAGQSGAFGTGMELCEPSTPPNPTPPPGPTPQPRQSPNPRPTRPHPGQTCWRGTRRCTRRWCTCRTWTTTTPSTRCWTSCACRQAGKGRMPYCLPEGMPCCLLDCARKGVSEGQSQSSGLSPKMDPFLVECLPACLVCLGVLNCGCECRRGRAAPGACLSEQPGSGEQQEQDAFGLRVNAHGWD